MKEKSRIWEQIPRVTKYIEISYKEIRPGREE